MTSDMKYIVPSVRVRDIRCVTMCIHSVRVRDVWMHTECQGKGRMDAYRVSG